MAESRMILSFFWILLVAVTVKSLYVCPPECGNGACISSSINFTINCKNRNLTQIPLFNDPLLEYPRTEKVIVDLADNNIATLQAQSFPNLAALYTLVLSGNNISTFHRDWAGTVNTTITRLFLNGNLLSTTELHKALADVPNLSVLHVSSNPLGTLDFMNGSLNMDSLTELSAKNVGLGEIGPSDLSGLPSLKKLFLDDNSMVDINSQAFSAFGSKLNRLELADNLLSSLSFLEPLSSLQHLRLDNNNIVDVTGLASVAQTLEWLSLSGNPLTSLGKDPLEKFAVLGVLEANDCMISGMDLLNTSSPILTSLNLLALSNNQLTVLPDQLGDFNGLETLNISGNNISSFPRSFKTMDNLTNLRALDASNNHLLYTPRRLIQFHPNLVSVNFSHNVIIWIGANTTYYSSSLVNLDLSHNEISNIEVDALRGIRNGTKINLDSNKIFTLYDDLFQYESVSGITLSFRDNPMYLCNCYGNWINLIRGQVFPAQCQSYPALTILSLTDWPCDPWVSITTSQTINNSQSDSTTTQTVLGSTSPPALPTTTSHTSSTEEVASRERTTISVTTSENNSTEEANTTPSTTTQAVPGSTSPPVILPTMISHTSPTEEIASHESTTISVIISSGNSSTEEANRLSSTSVTALVNRGSTSSPIVPTMISHTSPTEEVTSHESTISVAISSENNSTEKANRSPGTTILFSPSPTSPNILPTTNSHTSTTEKVTSRESTTISVTTSSGNSSTEEANRLSSTTVTALVNQGSTFSPILPITISHTSPTEEVTFHESTISVAISSENNSTEKANRSPSTTTALFSPSPTSPNILPTTNSHTSTTEKVTSRESTTISVTTSSGNSSTEEANRLSSTTITALVNQGSTSPPILPTMTSHTSPSEEVTSRESTTISVSTSNGNSSTEEANRLSSITVLVNPGSTAPTMLSLTMSTGVTHATEEVTSRSLRESSTVTTASETRSHSRAAPSEVTTTVNRSSPSSSYSSQTSQNTSDVGKSSRIAVESTSTSSSSIATAPLTKEWTTPSITYILTGSTGVSITDTSPVAAASLKLPSITTVAIYTITTVVMVNYGWSAY